MKQVVQNYRDGKLSVQDVPPPTIRPGGVLVATRASLISVGTERSTVDTGRKSLAGKAMDRPDLVRKVLDKAQKDGVVDTLKMVSSRLDSPVALGYSCAGVVLEVGAGVDGFTVGDRVACAGQDYASHAEVVFVPKNLCVKMPDSIGFDDAAYVTLGAIAMQGVRQADPKLGDVVAVIGLGVVGQLIAQLLKANGCIVLASEPDADKRALAERLGVDAAVRPDALGDEVAARTGGHGVDAVIIAASTKSDGPIAAAGEICRQKGRVVVVGAVGMAVPREPYYRKELDLRLSTSYGPGRYDPSYEEKGHDYPYGYVRWTERRNMAAFLTLVDAGKLDLAALTSHRYPIERSEQAYKEILSGQEAPLGVLLNYSEDIAPVEQRAIHLRARADTESVRLGLIGAGNHVRDMLIPALKGVPETTITAVCTQRGVQAKTLGDRLGVAYCTTDYQEILGDDAINAVLIGTRHDSHGAIVLDALRAGKHVFVEKPLCLSEDELDEISALYAEKAREGLRLAVGFNRRFSAHCDKAREFLGERRRPLVMTYRANAGLIPAEHWVQDPSVGGGRIIGEACHFVDYLQAICGARVTSVHARCTGAAATDPAQDEAILSLGFADGSVGSIIYAAGGDRGVAKERFEAMGDGAAVVMDDFGRSEFHRNGRRSVFKSRKRDKGFATQMAAFCTSVRDGAAPGMAFDDVASVTRTCLRAVDSMKTGMVYDI